MVLKSLLVMLVLAIVAGAAAFVHHVGGARFVSSAQLVEVSSEACLARMTAQGFGPSSAGSICADAEGSPWFAFTVRNVGHRGAWMNHCVVRAFDASGKAVYRTEIGFGGPTRPNGPAGPYLDPGAVFRDSWYSTAQYPKATAVRLTAECPPIDYHGNVPV